MIYLFTDGFVAQKSNMEEFLQLLTSVANKKPEEQKQIIQQALKDQTARKEQTDDVLIVGIRI